MRYILHSCAAAGMLAITAGMAVPAAKAESGVSVRVGPGGVGVRVGDHDRRHGRRGRHYGWGPGFYFYDGYYHGNCRWLRNRAEETGSRTWWRRYRQCREG